MKKKVHRLHNLNMISLYDLSVTSHVKVPDWLDKKKKVDEKFCAILDFDRFR